MNVYEMVRQHVWGLGRKLRVLILDREDRDEYGQIDTHFPFIFEIKKAPLDDVQRAVEARTLLDLWQIKDGGFDLVILGEDLDSPISGEVIAVLRREGDKGAEVVRKTYVIGWKIWWRPFLVGSCHLPDAPNEEVGQKARRDLFLEISHFLERGAFTRPPLDTNEGSLRSLRDYLRRTFGNARGCCREGGYGEVDCPVQCVPRDALCEVHEPIALGWEVVLERGIRFRAGSLCPLTGGGGHRLEAMDMDGRAFKISIQREDQHADLRGLRPLKEGYQPLFMPGKRKFVLAIVGVHTLLSASSNGLSHFDALLSYWEKHKGKGEIYILGGGTIEVDATAKTISFEGESGDYGPFDHITVERLAREAMAYEGFEGWTLAVKPSATKFPPEKK